LIAFGKAFKPMLEADKKCKGKKISLYKDLVRDVKVARNISQFIRF
jgi:hypothetical protein